MCVCVCVPAKPENHEISKFCKKNTIFEELQEFLRFGKDLREFVDRM